MEKFFPCPAPKVTPRHVPLSHRASSLSKLFSLSLSVRPSPRSPRSSLSKQPFSVSLGKDNMWRRSLAAASVRPTPLFQWRWRAFLHRSIGHSLNLSLPSSAEPSEWAPFIFRFCPLIGHTQSLSSPLPFPPSGDVVFVCDKSAMPSQQQRWRRRRRNTRRRRRRCT